MISAIIITKNETTHIAACLESLAWVDEIIVLDSGSKDDTVAICHRYTEQIFETNWPGFGIQKQRALDKATGNWVLSIDADETVSDALKSEIIQVIAETKFNGFQVPRLSNYCGQSIHYGGWWPDYTPRLFRRECGHFTDAQVHERIVVEGQLGRLQHPILHDSFVDLEEVLNKINNYSSLGAQMRWQQGKRATLTKAILSGLWTFIRTFIIKRAFLDGSHGLMLSISNAEGAYYKYAKLWLLQNQQAPY